MSEFIIPRLAIQRAIEALTHVKARVDDRTERQHQRDIDELRALLAASPAALTDDQIVNHSYAHSADYDEPLFTFDRRALIAFARALLAAASPAALTRESVANLAKGFMLGANFDSFMSAIDSRLAASPAALTAKQRYDECMREGEEPSDPHDHIATWLHEGDSQDDDIAARAKGGKE